MGSRRLFWLYRPTAPSVRAQAIQVVNAAHATASRGHRVVLAVEPPPGAAATPAEVLTAYGLAPVEGLRLVVLRGGRTAASLAFRALFLRWMAEGGGVVVARSKRYADEAVRWAERLGLRRRMTLVLEAHEVDSAQAAERGEDPAPLRALEARLLGAAAGVVTNAPGTLELLREVHGPLPPAVALHNATHPARIRRPTGPGEGIGYVGSFLAVKDLATLAEVAPDLPERIHLVGATGAEALQPLAAGRLVLEPPLPHVAVPDRLARFRVLVLPLGDGLFGRRLTSPLKLWDYLASGVPVVAADTEAVRAAAGGAFVPYRPGDPGSLREALVRACTDHALRARVLSAAQVRTWADRAAELDAFLDGLGAGAAADPSRGAGGGEVRR